MQWTEEREIRNLINESCAALPAAPTGLYARITAARSAEAAEQPVAPRRSGTRMTSTVADITLRTVLRLLPPIAALPVAYGLGQRADISWRKFVPRIPGEQLLQRLLSLAS